MTSKRRMTVDDLLGPELSAELKPPDAPSPPAESPSAPVAPPAASDDPFSWDEPAGTGESAAAEPVPQPPTPPPPEPPLTPAPSAEASPLAPEPEPQADPPAPVDAGEAVKAPLPPPAGKAAPRPPQPGQSIAKGRIPSVPRPKPKPKTPSEPTPALAPPAAAANQLPADELKALLVNVPEPPAPAPAPEPLPAAEEQREVTPPPTDERVIATDHEGRRAAPSRGFPTYELGEAARALWRWFRRLPLGAQLGAVAAIAMVVLLLALVTAATQAGPPRAFVTAGAPLLGVPLEHYEQDPRPAVEVGEPVEVIEDRGKFALVRTDENQLGWLLSATLADDPPPLAEDGPFTLCYRRVTEATGDACMARAAAQSSECLQRCAELPDKVPCEVSCNRRADACRLSCPHTKAVLRAQERAAALPEELAPEPPPPEPAAVAPAEPEPSGDLEPTSKEGKAKKGKKKGKKAKVKKSRYSLPD